MADPWPFLPCPSHSFVSATFSLTRSVHDRDYDSAGATSPHSLHLQKAYASAAASCNDGFIELGHPIYHVGYAKFYRHRA
ncbi:hypothetical protein V496_09776 [Pseudogymnoascus sp. VKM F-4515 (FW-2607)]|nr:hypothetical protein V496_09776 [Pseudogymnoascus sp. VKM F-4515 (FW-2607)]